MPLVMSMSAKVTSRAGAPGTLPCAQASKTKVSFGQGEKAIRSGADGAPDGAPDRRFG